MQKRLTLGEIAAIENLSGVSIDSLMDEGTPKGKALAALVFVAKKREDPDFTFDDALNTDMDEAMEIVNATMGDEDPKEAA